MKSKLDGLITAVLVICALVTTALVIRREFTKSPTTTIQPANQEPVFVPDWRSELAQGVQLGQIDAPIQLFEFADFECPFCSSFHATLKTIRERYPTEVSLSYLHFPLPGHQFALPAARAAECAGLQGRFEAMHDRLFEQQSSFGVKSWSDYASASGVANLEAFEKCMESTDAFPRIEAGETLAKKLGILGTPTLIINGWKLGHPPTIEELDEMIKAVLAGESPISGH